MAAVKTETNEELKAKEETTPVLDGEEKTDDVEAVNGVDPEEQTKKKKKKKKKKKASKFPYVTNYQ